VEKWQRFHGHDFPDAAALDIAEMEAAGLLVIDPDDEATVERVCESVERVCESLDRYEWSLWNAARDVINEPVRPWDEMSERMHRLRRNQYIDTARAVVAALRGAR
jgi:hypothetical protein